MESRRLQLYDSLVRSSRIRSPARYAAARVIRLPFPREKTFTNGKYFAKRFGLHGSLELESARPVLYHRLIPFIRCRCC